MKRILYVDYLKSFAIIGVIVIHLCSNYITESGLNSLYWHQGLFMESMARFSIILFVMASGVLLLNKKQDVEDIPRRLKRVLVPFIGWFIIYFIIKMNILYSTEYVLNNLLYLFIKAVLDPTILSVQFWFIYMIVGVYLASPIISTWIQHTTIKQIEYFLLVWFIVLVLNMLPVKILMLDYLGFFGGFIGYFILGYYLSIKKSSLLENRKFGLLLYVAGTLLTFCGVAVLSTLSHSLDLTFMKLGDLTVNACIQAVGIFIIIKNTNYSHLKDYKNNIFNRSAMMLSILSYGIYLSNILLINLLKMSGIYSLNIMPIMLVPILTAVIIIILSILLLLLNNIPVLRKLTGLKY